MKKNMLLFTCVVLAFFLGAGCGTTRSTSAKNEVPLPAPRPSTGLNTEQQNLLDRMKKLKKSANADTRQASAADTKTLKDAKPAADGEPAARQTAAAEKPLPSDKNTPIIPREQPKPAAALPAAASTPKDAGDYVSRNEFNKHLKDYNETKRIVIVNDQDLANRKLADMIRSNGLKPDTILFQPGQVEVGPSQNRAIRDIVADYRRLMAKTGGQLNLYMYSFASEDGDDKTNQKRSDARLESVDKAIASALPPGVNIVKKISMGESKLANYPHNNICVRIFPEWAQ
jgi:hypothetical protein